MTLTIRPARPSDLQTLMRMIRALSAYHGDEASTSYERLQKMLFGQPGISEPRGRAFLAEESGKPVGYMGMMDTSALHENVPRYDIHHLYVVDTHRGRGVGRSLIEEARRFARSQNAQTLTIGTALENEGAQTAYRRMGLKEFSAYAPRFLVALEYE